MIAISPSHFRAAFESAIVESQVVGDDVFALADKDATLALRTRFFPRIAVKLGLKCYPPQDFYTLDAIFYEEFDLVNFPRGTYPKSIAVAIEHENMSTRSHEEMYKFQLFKAPLKVLIVYHPEGTATNQLLTKYEGIIQQSGYAADLLTRERQLVVIGTPRTAEKWRYYVYGQDGFRELAD
jgi:hypothetical protein